MKMSNHMKKIYKYYLNLLVENQSALMAGKKESRYARQIENAKL